MIGVVGEALVMTALMVALVLAVRQPVAALFGPKIAYMLWLLPPLRLLLPPLPGGERLISNAPPEGATMLHMAAVPGTEEPAVWLWLAEQFATVWPLVWLVGFGAVLGHAVWSHNRWLRDVMVDSIELAPIDGIRLVMSEAVQGPVATGLRHPLIAVPSDFFARYNRNERALAVDHELAHHRAGDLWANAAALLLLAVQWFNPLAWAALRAFRFDQEAACDARVMTGIAPIDRQEQAHSYARAIAKSLTGPRLVLAAPMTSGDGVKERLRMLSYNPRLGQRPLLGRLLIGGAMAAVLTATISTFPARVVYAAEPGVPAPVAAPTAPLPPAPPASPEAPAVPGNSVMIFTSKDVESIDLSGGDTDTPAEAGKRKAQRIIMHHVGEGGAAPSVKLIHTGDGKPQMAMVRVGRPFSEADEQDVRAALAEQGIKGAKADAVVNKLREKRTEAAARKQAIWHDGQTKRADAEAHRAMAHARSLSIVATAPCAPGSQPQVMVDRSSEGQTGKADVRMLHCGGEISREKQLEAMKKARDRLAADTVGEGLSAQIRASVIADLEKAIAELRAGKD
jgi:beta-lactamase regulating signal transducer with metallopeptidase domain